MKTKKFKIEFVVEVDEKRLKSFAEADVSQVVVGMVEAVWDSGQDKQKEDRPDGSPVHDSYGFEAEQIDG